MSNKRDSKIELLRIIAMFFILANHYVNHGILQVSKSVAYKAYSVNYNIFNNLFVSVLSFGGRIGVALFFMITGYFMINKNKISLKKIFAILFFYAFFYAIIIIPIMIKTDWLDMFSRKNLAYYLIGLFFNPICNDSWWFVTSYILLILISDKLNKLFHSIKQKYKLLFIIFAFIIYNIIAFSINSKYYSLVRGIPFYLTGGYICYLKENDKLKEKAIIYLLTAVILWILSGILGIQYYMDIGRGIVHQRFINSNRVLTGFFNFVSIPIISISIFLLFINMKSFYNNKINLAAQTVFGVYLLHDSMFSRELLWNKIFNVAEKQWGNSYFIIEALGTIFGLYILFSLIDLIRIKVFEKRILLKIDKIQEKYCNIENQGKTCYNIAYEKYR